jgi:mannan endo-1,4-beta-mannosidase
MKTGKNWGLLGQTLALMTLSVALAGCGGSSDAGSPSSTNTSTPAGASVASATPSVSGTPPLAVAADNHYSFQPTLVNPTGIPVSFSILNKPVWATFGPSTGELSGTPAAPDTGSYDNIVISASDGSTTSALPAFSIKVTAPGTTPTSSSSSGGTSSSSGASSTSASASGTMIPSATQIIDSAHNVWTLTGGVIDENAAAAGVSTNVSLLLYYGGTIYQENKSCLWWSWNGSTWVATSNPAPSVTPACSAAVASATSSSGASTTTATALLSYLTGLAGDSRHILTGQHTSYWDSNPEDNITALYNQTGTYPAILGTTVGIVGSQENGVALSNQWLAAGGIVEVSMWPNNPQTGQDDDTRTGFNFPDIYTPGTALNAKWNAYLDTIAAQLKAINGPVLFRPFVEVNGNWVWWGAQPTAQFVALYQYTYNRIVKTDGVNNALWIYNVNIFSGNYTGDGNGNGGYYPGSAYVDIVSEDAYPPAANDPTYAALATLGKPIILAEAGVNSPDNSSVAPYSGDNSKLLAVVKASYPKVVAIVLWCQNYSLSEQQGDEEFMTDAATISRADLPAGL